MVYITHKNGLHKFVSAFLCVIISAALLCGCGTANDGSGAENTINAYYITADIDSLVTATAQLDEASQGDLQEALNSAAILLGESPDPKKLIAPLGPDSGFKSVTCKGDQAVVDFDDKITSMDVISKTLIMGASTRTFTQLNGINSVSFSINGSPMLDSSGMVIGALSAESFLDNEGLQINAEESTQLTLYFANETGDGLIKVNRMVVYSGNIPMDKLVVMQLLEGPHDGENAYPVMNPETKLINVTTQDGTCYVNLDSSFLNPTNNISNDVAIYSIVDSLIELGSVNKVQFLIDSDSDVMFRETVSLNTQFDRNLDILDE